MLKKFEVISNIIDGIPEVNQTIIVQKLINLDLEILEMTLLQFKSLVSENVNKLQS